MSFSIESYCHSVSLRKFRDFRSSTIRAVCISSFTRFSHFSMNTTKLNAWFFYKWKTYACMLHTIMNLLLCPIEKRNQFLLFTENQRLKSQNTWTFLPPRWYETIKSFSNSDVSFGSILIMLLFYFIFYSIKTSDKQMISAHCCLLIDKGIFILFWQMMSEWLCQMEFT